MFTKIICSSLKLPKRFHVKEMYTFYKHNSKFNVFLIPQIWKVKCINFLIY